MKSVNAHHEEMSEMKKLMTSSEKEIDSSTMDDGMSSCDSDSDNNDENHSPGTEKATKEQIDAFKGFYDSMLTLIEECSVSASEYSMENVVEKLTLKRDEINSIKDRYERTILHVAVEEKKYMLVKILLAVGVNINAKEGCGATPLFIAVINNDIAMCTLLLENFAQYRAPYFAAIQTPKEMAIAMGLDDIVELLNGYEQDKYSKSVAVLENEAVLTKPLVTPLPENNDITLGDISEDTSDTFVYKRSDVSGFPTGIVGDVGTCKVNRSVRNRNNTAYSWSTDIPGDMHTRGHLCEALFKAHGKGGFHEIVHTVMKRTKLTEEAFRKRKFQDQNLQHIQEAAKDCSLAYGYAAVHEFRSSVEFPSDGELQSALRKDGSHNKILLFRFKNWLEDSGKCDKNHKYHQQLFTLFGPLLDLFITAGREGDGTLRETAWVLLLPIFAQLNFRNYWTEAFVHVTNFTSLWPLAFRRMIVQNSSVNMSGKRGHNLDMDEYVETHVVRPLKTYASGMCSATVTCNFCTVLYVKY